MVLYEIQNAIFEVVKQFNNETCNAQMMNFVSLHRKRERETERERDSIKSEAFPDAPPQLTFFLTVCRPLSARQKSCRADNSPI